MTKLSCIIVEDEPLAASVLQDYIRQTPTLELISTCPDALYALEVLHEQPIDVLFLDIHLPKLKGLDFLRTLSQAPQVILTTAYHQYALESYELSVVDYLVKPITFSRFLQAVGKLRRPQPATVPVAPAAATPERAYRFFNVGRRMERVFLDEILFIESLREYVRIHTTGGRTTVTQAPIGELENQLPPGDFLRIHRSYLVALRQVSAFTATTVETAGQVLPVGRSYQVKVGEVLRAVGSG